MQTQLKLCKLFTLLILIYFNFTKLIAQSTDAGLTGNVRGPLKFLGWNGAGPAGFLNVRNDFNFPINFSTGPAQNERLRLWQRGPGLMLPGFPLSAPNPYPGVQLTRVAIPVDGNAPIGVPFSALHIGYGWGNPLTQPQGGFRDWMNVGTMYMEGTDNLYVGLREKAPVGTDPSGRQSPLTAIQSDDQDAVIAWGDNQSGPVNSPNNLTFIFNSIRTNANPAYEFTNYGREVARMTPMGMVGIGPVFFDNAQPQNLLHLNNDLTNASYLQISNAGATGQTATDGFHLGITPGPIVTTGGIAELKQFEDKDMRFFTNNTQWMVIKENANGNIGRVGIRINNPGNRLEVNSAAGDPGGGSFLTPGGSSGIRTTNMTSNSPTIPNPGAGVLSVDVSGDIIYVPSPTVSTGGGFGNLCTAAQNPLTGNFEIPLGTFQYKFTGQGLIDNVTKEDIVSVGYSCAQIPPSRFSVLENQAVTTNVQTYAGHFNNNNASTPVFTGIPLETAGIFTEAKQNVIGTPNYVNHNIGAICEATGAINSIGTVGRIAKSSLPINIVGPRYAIGGAFMSDTSVSNIVLPSVPNFGVYASAFNSLQSNYGVYAEVNNTGVGGNYGIFAKAPAGTGSDFAGYFDGDVFRTGNDNFSSDAILKQNFDSIPNALGIINQLVPKRYTYNTSQYPQMSLPSGIQYGVVAQDVQQILPELVNSVKYPERNVNNITYSAFTFSTVEYQQFIPILIRAVQQLSAQNQKLDSMLTALTQTVNACCSNSNARTTGIQGNQSNAVSQLNIDLSDKDVIVLNQNVPNPFAEQTTITYNVPEKYGFAQLVFKTVDGKIIKTVDITKKGRGQVNVFANDLSNGLYMYSLVVDGVVVDTKKMVKQ